MRLPTAPPNTSASPAAVQRARLRARGLEEAAIEALLARQMPDAEKRARADWVIPGTTFEAARQAVQDILAAIRYVADFAHDRPILLRCRDLARAWCLLAAAAAPPEVRVSLEGSLETSNPIPVRNTSSDSNQYLRKSGISACCNGRTESMYLLLLQVYFFKFFS